MLYQLLICSILATLSPLMAQENPSLPSITSVDTDISTTIQVHWENDTAATLLVGQMEVRLDKSVPSFIQLPSLDQKLLIYYKGNYYKPDNGISWREGIAHITISIRDSKLDIKSESGEEYQLRQQLKNEIKILPQQAIVNKIAAQMIHVQGGSFSMGCIKETEGPCYEDELPRRTVFVNSFSISKYEVSVQEWLSVMGYIPEQDNSCSQCPVENISWQDAMDFIATLNKLSGKQYRLPTEAEWEFAARGGKLGKGNRYSGGENLDLVGWYGQNSRGKKQSIGQLSPNELGLYDMSGNVWEWCSDWASDNYKGMEVDNPKGPESGEYRIIRGGSWYNKERNCTVFYRGRYLQNGRGNNCGLRLCMDAVKK